MKKSVYSTMLVAALLLTSIAAPIGRLDATPSTAQSMQTRKVTGKVVDENGQPMIGVSVAVKGTALGTTTGVDGTYSLNVASGATLEFSYLGYKSQTVAVGAQTTIDISLVTDATGLEEVVVIGYGTTKKRDLTGSVASVKSDDIMQRPTSNVMEAIQGKVAGLDIVRSTGDASSGVNMTLRGNRSINGSNSPLFIIDGMEGSYSELNPSDISSVEVLKDASSTAVYGSAGANGVIIITTKNPAKDKFSINLDAYHGWNVITSFPEVNTGENYINFRREAKRTVGEWSSSADDASLFPSYIQNYIDNDQWVNWADELSQTGSTNSYNISTSYANDRVNSYMSLGYYDLEGLFKGDQMERYTARAKVDFTPSKYVKYGLNLYGMYSDNDQRYSRVWNRVLCMIPLGTPYDEYGNVVSYPIDGEGTMSPLADSDSSQYANNVKTISLAPQAYIEFTPLKGLSFRSVIGGYLRNAKTGSYTGSKSYQGLESGLVQGKAANSMAYNYKWQNILTYDFSVARDHHFTLTGVTEWSMNRSESSSAVANGFDSDDYLYFNLGASTGTPTVASDYMQSQMMSYVARLNYSFKGRYLLTLSTRYDGSSILADGNKWAMFPAAAVAWRVSDEPFMQNVEKISNLKLRASYGVTGNAGASAYATMDYSRTGIYGMQDVSTPYSGYSISVANKSLDWEKSYMTDLGFELGLFKDRLTVEFDWYSTKTKDLLYKVSLPYSQGGYGSSPFQVWSNVGETLNRGIELNITSRNIVKPNFQWSTTLTFARNHEEVVKTTSEDPLQFGSYYLIPGQPINTIYTYKYLGIWSTDEAEQAAKYNRNPGQVKIDDVDDGGSISSADYQIIGSATPKWTGSLLNTFTYKNWDLNVLMVARWGWTMFYGVTGWYRQNGLSPSPTICDYWTPEDQSGRYPRPNANSSDDYASYANYFDASYVKIKNIQLGYNLPERWLDNVKIDRARIYFTASDPLIWTKSKYLKDYDPEKGGDDDQTPLSKQFVFGINITF